MHLNEQVSLALLRVFVAVLSRFDIVLSLQLELAKLQIKLLFYLDGVFDLFLLVRVQLQLFFAYNLELLGSHRKTVICLLELLLVNLSVNLSQLFAEPSCGAIKVLVICFVVVVGIRQVE